LARGQNTKPNLSGNWQLNTAKSELRSGKAAAIGLAIEQKGSSIHVIKTAKATDGKEMKTEFHCTTDGKECLVDGTKISCICLPRQISVSGNPVRDWRHLTL
jgi:hypothetical protein